MIDKEKVFSALAIDSVVGAMRGEGDLQRVSHKQEQEKYTRLRPKLELIAERLRHGSCREIENEDSINSTPPQDDILYISKSGDIMFNANAFFDILDKNKDGVLSFTELNEVMCLGDDQLKAFIANMQARTEPRLEQKSTAHLGTVSRDTFVRCFLDALADAANLEPTPEEAGRLFQEIAGEVGYTPTSHRRGLRASFKSSKSTPLLSIPVERLHMSPTLTSFLSDMQIYGIVSRFKKKQREEGVKVGEISQEEFVEHYPRFLGEVTRPDFTSSFVTPNKAEGLDVTFQHLSLAVKVGKAQVNVLDDVSGRFCSNTMVAVMGGTGSGKSSLLNALCGRAYYGKVSGKVFVNGNESKIEEQQAVIGFVPQEDIVYPDLTVKENLLYAGRLTLPAGTRREEIAELADEVMASLGLSRIANSLVGDARRRGISGGEKKRVNVGIELMKRPRLLFLE
jgi:ABC-type lipoprotein export system ATPase subunit